MPSVEDTGEEGGDCDGDCGEETAEEEGLVVEDEGERDEDVCPVS